MHVLILNSHKQSYFWGAILFRSILKVVKSYGISDNKLLKRIDG